MKKHLSMTGRPLTVLYIAGAGRSGSTLLDRVLGEVEGFFSVGELSQIWEHAVGRQATCGCGKPFAVCETWLAILDSAYGGLDQVDVPEMIRQRDRMSVTALFRGTRSLATRQRLAEQHGEYLEALGRLYGAIRDVTGCRVIVDSSKFPTYAVILSLVPGIDLRPIHLVRDARGHAYSCSRKKGYLDQTSPLMACLAWIRANLSAEILLRRPGSTAYRRFRHEDVVRQPEATLRAICDHLDAHPAELPVDGHTITFHENHTVGGNIDRFQAGPTKLRLDAAWKKRLPARHRRLVQALAWPLLLRYHYGSIKS